MSQDRLGDYGEPKLTFHDIWHRSDDFVFFKHQSHIPHPFARRGIQPPGLAEQGNGEFLGAEGAVFIYAIRQVNFQGGLSLKNFQDGFFNIEINTDIDNTILGKHTFSIVIFANLTE